MKECTFVPFRHLNSNGFDFFSSESAQKWIFPSFHEEKKSFHKPIELKSFIIFILSMLKKCAKSSDDGNFFSFQNCMNNRENFGTVWWIMNWARKLWKVMIFFFLLPSSIKLIRFSSLSFLSSLFDSPKQFFIFFSNPNKKAQNYQTFFLHINIIVNISGEANHK